MKKEILNEIEYIKTTLEHPIFYLKNKLRYLDGLNCYWDVLAFIHWVKDNYPKEYNQEQLEGYYQHICDFGHFYIRVFNPQPSPIIYEDGTLGISIPIDEMINELYDHVINLNESEATDLKVVLESIDLLRESIVNTKYFALKNDQFRNMDNSRLEAKIDSLIEHVNPTTKYSTKEQRRVVKAKAEVSKILLKK